MSTTELLLLVLAVLAALGLGLWWRQLSSRTPANPVWLAGLQEQVARLERQLREDLSESARRERQELGETLHLAQQAQAQQLRLLQQSINETLHQQLQLLQQSNNQRLEEMRRTVDERLQTTLEQRLTESFRQVAERLEQVHQGLGQMQGLAKGVGDLQKILTNVKTRGVFGEIQLEALLEQVLTPEQFGKQIETRPQSHQRVDFAVRFPGRSGQSGEVVWLPIDAKFPREDYERLLEAQDRADAAGAEVAARALEARIRSEARRIAESYLAPPHTTEFGVLFLPVEGLYAEVLRRPGLMDDLHRHHRITIAGPTTLLAMLNSLQMGFRTLALEQQASEVWKVLGAVKTEFERYCQWVDKVREQVHRAAETLDKADTRHRQMRRALRHVEAVPEEEAQQRLGAPEIDGPEHEPPGGTRP